MFMPMLSKPGISFLLFNRPYLPPVVLKRLELNGFLTGIVAQTFFMHSARPKLLALLLMVFALMVL